MFRIRQAYELEAAKLAEFQLRCALVAYAHIFPPQAPAPSLDATVAQWTQWLSGPASRTAFVAESDSLLGVALAGPDPMDEWLGHLSRLYVSPGDQGRGTGRRLYDACMEHLRSRGFSEATLWVLEHNKRARAWYERLGWELTGERKAVWEPGGIDDLRYRISVVSPT